jgi:hypothetical protein
LAALTDWLGLAGTNSPNWQICAFASAISLAVALGAALVRSRRTYTERRLLTVIDDYAEREIAREQRMRALGRARTYLLANKVNGLSGRKPNGPTAL